MRRVFSTFKRPQGDGLEALRNLTRYRTHGGYTWAGVTDDGDLLCVECMRDNYREVFAATRDGSHSGWCIMGATHSGESEETERCAHCNELLWEVEA